ncbi:chitobiosyldiphosphodolichol beta-mannosyltransferase [Aspergillus lentulus]|uniref:Chitobiosyldiphosphodolichol beta-mannosyltransferase n=1 Tax=Aspergillus lentulus TaxID=293939 RepID=A0ABQ1AGM9_ASPLE|nr:chitobiosyldiphosphodolichol beta-mannosyltransferase [Aspergillus lentulus]GFF52909.1 chitobiosyldiphosphodolichol beta-mannosyltransferase [Aspergillus lentulus]GFF55783.1 chitobiosyldiphosphodolichol beta-mannosyltransferase [Aspergillus lentulus]GFF81549.1 chitobiosyldiphosphodolichol beta-mannosyltransferase [Aspergillus lentulus]GFF81554.1 chitobiosyldiphosphodolichol beta-mannosyltransferase [Aspergillus lentulus]
MIESLISVAFYISTAVTLLLFLVPSRYSPKRPDRSKRVASNAPKTTTQILVLGDIGRSPRMQYHALSIARGGGQVEIIGYNESEVHPDISSNPRISIIALPPHPTFLQTSNKLLFLLFGPLKVAFQIVCLWWALAYRTEPAQWLLVQNPPSIPTLAIASMVSFLRHTKLIIDWHNFGYTILALKLGGRHPLVRFSKWYEKSFCRYATAHFCVTEAMASILKSHFGLTAPILPLHDRPASHFQPIVDERERKRFLESLSETASVKDLLQAGSLRVIVSSTSWTADEDFSLLIDALCRYSNLATTSKPGLPAVLAIITGKGPQKDMYLKQISKLEEAGKLSKVTIRTAWLTTDDYARLLASASLGISLHTSSSGVDLPMKVVDMFGAGLPVLGWDRFQAWPELVTEGVNGVGFGSSGELLDHLVDLFENPSKLEKIRTGARKESNRRWNDEWDPIAGKLLGLA